MALTLPSLGQRDPADHHQRHNVEYGAKVALAQTQAGQQQYQSALATYAEILNDDR